MRINQQLDGQFTLTMFHGRTTIQQDDLLQLDAEVNYTTLTLISGRRILTAYTLKKFEEFLPSDDFIRLNKSTITNVKHIVGVDQDVVHLTNQETIKVSRRRLRGVKRRLK